MARSLALEREISAAMGRDLAPIILSEISDGERILRFRSPITLIPQRSEQGTLLVVEHPDLRIFSHAETRAELGEEIDGYILRL